MTHDSQGPVPVARPHLPPRERFAELISDLFETRMLSNFSKYCQMLESRAALVLEHPAPRCVSSCDIGLTLAWKALECPAGEVIVPSFTFCSTVNALRWNGLEPVFADVDPATYCIDSSDARRLITRRTVGICAVHTFGLPAAIHPLEQLAAGHGLKLVFDAAHGLGGRYHGQALGSFGDASVFSLSATKLVTSGEGGLATFRDPAATERFTLLRAYGFKDDYNCRYTGLNGKLSELNAALGWLSLDLLGEALERRQAQVEHYKQALADCPAVFWQHTPDSSQHGYKDLALRLQTGAQRAAVANALAEAGFMTKRYFFPVHRMDAYRQHARRSLPVTDYLHDRLLCVPLYHDLSFESIDAIAQVIIEAVGSVELHSIAMPQREPGSIASASEPPKSYQAEVA
jgi:dTDP-4-amino-4,6-dideoxygalactose transaminase